MLVRERILDKHSPGDWLLIKNVLFFKTANYRISDCMQMNGELRRYYNTVREWHAKNKRKLIEAWNKHRPTDCPVGKYQEA
jgi:hypothetical protein